MPWHSTNRLDDECKIDMMVASFSFAWFFLLFFFFMLFYLYFLSDLFSSIKQNLSVLIFVLIQVRNAL
jgi:hypothetical protein